MAPPATLETTAYEAAAQVPLPEREPDEQPGLHNVYRLSDSIVSGAEPEGAAALARLAKMGIKTILSVDGKAPDAATAERLGMRYVHVPIQYRGISDDETLKIVKSFRELEGPFYVHCFHGQHRGPAAAALGRVVLDGVRREQAIAEMRQWCGTSGKYEGLYADVAIGELPSEAATAALQWDFPSIHPLEGFRQAMVDVSRSYDRIKAMAGNAWQVNPDHPDIDPLNEAAVLADVFSRIQHAEELSERPEDFRAWMAEAPSLATTLRDAVTGARESGDWTAASAAYAAVSANCKVCHTAYRND